MVRLTADLIQKCPQYMSPLKEREIDIRGHKIPEIENLGALMDQFDAIDLSDNDISVLGNVPVMKRVRTVMLHNNRIDSIAAGLCHYLPNLTNLVMHNNHLKTFEQLVPLSDLPSLERLSLLDNQVTKMPDYRLFVISRLPRLKQLDFQKVKPTEREAAEAKFGKASAPAPLSDLSRPQLSDESRARAAALISAATSLDELKRIEEKELPVIHPQ
eukprot:TRINITY_DN25003_c0_g1_i1.p1 TRINITY_DN25003_c0_g1~~TRINITY_DN25003_c0_g1_i1.p1  ORF type:complete len:215 (+),score=74.46 TRINITY_DN25003_c0_g1_i1:71-715(+)